jgi:hypothetical protein
MYALLIGSDGLWNTQTTIGIKKQLKEILAEKQFIQSILDGKKIVIEEYKKIFGDNFVLVNSPASTPEEFKEIENFQKAYDSGSLKEYFDNLLSSGEFQSTFRKDDSTLSPEELAKREKQREKTKELLAQSIDKISNTYKDIQSKLNPVDSKELPNIVKKFV